MSTDAQSFPLRELYLQAIRLENEAERESFLQSVCENQPQLRSRLEALLAARPDDQGGDLLEKAVANMEIDKDFVSTDGFLGTGDRSPEETQDLGGRSDSHPTFRSEARGSSINIADHPMIGHFKLLEEIGHGGMGTVYMAQQTEPVKRQVALKVIKPGMDTREVIARFEAERQALAMMDHPNIAKVLDGGTTDQGRPYFVMELVRGVTITEFCKQKKLPLRDRLELFIDVCKAVQHAHQKGIIHRDLKPSNLLVTMHDHVPVIKVIDFGVAKALNQELTDKTLFTQFSQMIGTPLYMAPEQAQMSGLDIDTRSDIYSLGVILYELLTGTTPFDRDTMSKLGADGFRKLLHEKEPERPSFRISTLKAQNQTTIEDQRQLDSEDISKQLKRELDWIVMKALEKDRERRYETANALAADVQRYLDDEPVQACPPSFGYFANRYVKRHRWLIGSATAVLFTAMIGATFSVRYALIANDSADEARNAEQTAKLAADNYKSLMLTAESNAAAATRSATEAQQAREIADVQSRRARRSSYVSDIRLADAQNDQGLQAEALASLTRHAGQSGADDPRGFEWYYVLGEANQSVLNWKASRSWVFGIDWSSDGELIATLDSTGACKVWDATTAQLKHEWNLSGGNASQVRWSDDGRFLAWTDGNVQIWNRDQDSVSKMAHIGSPIWSIRWNRDGSQLCAGSIIDLDGPPDQKTVRRFVKEDAESTGWVMTDSDTFKNNVRLVDWNADETRIWAISEQNGIRLYDPSSYERKDHQLPNKLHGARIRDGALANQSQRLAITSDNGWCAIYDEENQSEIAQFRAHWSEARPRWSPDDRYLATCGLDGFVKVWDAKDGTLHRTFSGHQGKVSRVAWSPDGSRIASCGYDSQVIVWSLDDSSDQKVHQLSGLNRNPQFFWVNNDRVQYIQDVGDEQNISEIDVLSGMIRKGTELNDANGKWKLVNRDLAICFSQDAQIVGCTDQELLDVIIGHSAKQLDAVAVNGTFKIVTNQGLRMRQFIHDKAATRQPILIGPKIVDCSQMRWSPDGRNIAIAGKGLQTEDGGRAYSGWLHLIDASDGSLLDRTRVGQSRVTATSVAWSVDGQYIAAGGLTGDCGVFDGKHLVRLCSDTKHRAAVRTLAFHPNGHRIASAGDDQTVLVWDASSGETLLDFPIGSTVLQVAWSPDGTKLAALTEDGELHVWDSSPGHQFSQSSGFQARIERAVRIEFEDAVAVNDWRLAAESAERWTEIDRSNDFYPFYVATLTQAASRATSAARQTLQIMIQRLGGSDDSKTLHFLSWTASLMPDSLENFDVVIQAARQSVELEPSNNQHLNGLGAILMRAGKYEQAKDKLASALEARESDNTSPSYTRYFLAMTEHHLGNSGAAEDTLSKANESAEKELADSPAWNRRLTLALLRREAETLIHGEPATSEDD